MRATTVTLKPPRRPDRRLLPVTANVVLVHELNPPQGDQPVEWILVTTLPIGSAEDVRTIIQYYTVRWMIELLFRILKSGCRVEERRFEHIDRLLPCLAIYVIAAWRTLMVCRMGRSCPDMSCEAIFEPAEWKPSLSSNVKSSKQTPRLVNDPHDRPTWLGIARARPPGECGEQARLTSTPCCCRS